MWSADGEDRFYYGPPVMKLDDLCWFHNKFGGNGNGNNHGKR